MVAPFAVGASCGEDQDPAAAGEVRLVDASRGCLASPTDLDAPVALGARLAVGLQLQNAVDPEVAAAQVQGPLAIEEVGNPTIIRAAAEGQGTITLTDVSGRSATADLTVRAVASSVVKASGEAALNVDIHLETPHPGATAPFTEAGYGLLPDGRLKVLPFLFDAEGRTLIGFDVANLSVTPPYVVLEDIDPLDDHVDAAPVGPPGLSTISAHGGGTLDIAVVPAGSASTLTVYWPEAGEAASSVALTVGEIRTVVGLPHDADGRLLLGADGDPYQVSSSDDAVVRTVQPPWEGGADMQAYLRELRVAYIEAVAAGQATLTLSVAGVSAEVSVTITAPRAGR